MFSFVSNEHLYLLKETVYLWGGTHHVSTLVQKDGPAQGFAILTWHPRSSLLMREKYLESDAEVTRFLLGRSFSFPAWLWQHSHGHQAVHDFKKFRCSFVCLMLSYHSTLLNLTQVYGQISMVMLNTSVHLPSNTEFNHTIWWFGITRRYLIQNQSFCVSGSFLWQSCGGMCSIGKWFNHL